MYYKTSHGGLELDSKAGAAGKGGTKSVTHGKPGKGWGPASAKCRGGKAGKGGAAGLPGKAGKPGKITKNAVEIDTWWKLVVDVAAKPAAKQWNEYRTRVGEFLFRSYLPAESSKKRASVRKAVSGYDDHLPIKDFGQYFSSEVLRPVKPGPLADARREFESALILRAKANGASAGSIYGALRILTGRAQVLLGHLNNGLTPIGLGYQIDLRPDFENYEDFITDYQDQRSDLFGQILDMLHDIKEGASDLNWAQVAKSHAENMAAAAKADKDLAVEEAKQAQLEFDKAQSDLDLIEAKIKKVQKDREDAEDVFSFMEIIEVVVIVVGAVAAIFGAAFSAGQTITGFISALGLLISTAEDDDITDLETWFDFDTMDLNDKGRKLKGEISDVADGTAKLIEKGKAVKALFEVDDGDDEFYQTAVSGGERNSSE